MTTVLAFDVGKTSCRAALFNDGKLVADARSDGAPGVAEPGGAAAALDAMANAARAAGAEQVDALGVGLAGLASAPSEADVIAKVLAGRHRTGRIALASDVVTAHAGALGGAAGVVVVAGTGSVALGLSGGVAVTVDGYGYLIGDVGGGHAIGRAGLDAALRFHDGRAGSAALAERAEKRFGPLTRFPADLYGSPSPAQHIASFALDVCALADEGDPTASRICAEAGRELARMAQAAATRLGMSGPVTITGGLWEAGDCVAAAFAEELRPIETQPAAGDARDGALQLALRDDLPHEQLVLRPPAGAS